MKEVRPSLVTLSTVLVLSSIIVGLTEGIQNCAVWKEIAPCTCKIEFSLTTINCERMGSFDEIVNILKDRFAPKDKISLRITSSNLYDLTDRSFDEFNMNIESLKLNHVNLSELRAYSFIGLTNVNYLSLSDNSIPIMPKEIFVNMPKVKTLDIGRIKLTSLPEDSFKSMPQLENLVLPGNLLSHVDSKSIPSTVRQLHIGRDMIKDLNGTLRELSELKWLFINANELTTLEGQLPKHGEKLRMIHASNNRIEKLPDDFKTLINLESLFFQYNLVTRLDGALSKSRKLQRAQFEHNRLNMLAEDDFTDAEKLESLLLGNNHLTALNGSVLPLRRLRVLNLTHNWFKEFSLEEVRGLPELKAIDLSHNRISKIIGMTPNLVEWETRLTHLELDHNEITSLNGSLSGLRNLLRLNLSHNKLTRILPDDLIGLDQLTMLDVSHNQLQTLEETSKTFLPALEELIAHHNQLTILDRDFHGLPVLCWADLSNNQIVALGRDLVSKTHCKVHGIHEDTWGTLKIYLQNNPILCDAALPEITAAFEINHTKIAGSSQCAPLSEQPTTIKPNAYLGYIPETKLNGLQVNPIYNQLNYRQPSSTTYLQENSNQQQREEQNERYYNTNLKPNNIEPQRDAEVVVQNTNLDNKLTQPPLPYQNQDNLLNLPVSNNMQQQKLLRSINPEDVVENHHHLHQQEQQSSSSTTPPPPPQEPLIRNTQTLYAAVDPVAQEQELNQLATKIEELKTRVEELRTQNQRLANQMLPKPQIQQQQHQLQQQQPLHQQQQPIQQQQQQQQEFNSDTNTTLTYT